MGKVVMKADRSVPLLPGATRRPGCQMVKVEPLVGSPTG
jgi:hypothetical protein